MAASSSVARRPELEEAPGDPVLAVTRYDRVSSFLVAITILVGVVVVWMGAVWMSQVWADPGQPVTVELIEIPGGDLLGAPGATLNVEAPTEQAVENPSDSEQVDEQAMIEKQLANWVDALSDVAVDIDDPELRDDAMTSGRRGSREGDSTLRSRGAGGAGSGMPREQRWLIYHDPGQSRGEYAKQLDFFKIELGVILDNRLIYVSRLATDEPRRRTGTPAEDRRIRWIWRGGSRRQADVELLTKAGIDAKDAIVMQFLPLEVEETLAALERSHAQGRPIYEIQQTAFRIRKQDSGYAFYVVDQKFY